MKNEAKLGVADVGSGMRSVLGDPYAGRRTFKGAPREDEDIPVFQDVPDEDQDDLDVAPPRRSGVYTRSEGKISRSRLQKIIREEYATLQTHGMAPEAIDEVDEEEPKKSSKGDEKASGGPDDGKKGEPKDDVKKSEKEPPKAKPGADEEALVFSWKAEISIEEMASRVGRIALTLNSVVDEDADALASVAHAIAVTIGSSNEALLRQAVDQADALRDTLIKLSEIAKGSRKQEQS